MCQTTPNRKESISSCKLEQKNQRPSKKGFHYQNHPSFRRQRSSRSGIRSSGSSTTRLNLTRTQISPQSRPLWGSRLEGVSLLPARPCWGLMWSRSDGQCCSHGSPCTGCHPPLPEPSDALKQVERSGTESRSTLCFLLQPIPDHAFVA
jgi:hypothetical protein